MVLTILEGRVEKGNWKALEKAYSEASNDSTPGLVQSYLIHNQREDDIWRIMTLWSSQEALEAMRRSNETPRGVLIFRQAHTEPVLSIYNVVQQLNAKEDIQPTAF